MLYSKIKKDFKKEDNNFMKEDNRGYKKRGSTQEFNERVAGL